MSDSREYAPAGPDGRPEMPRLWADLYDEWLVPNGVVGWMPIGSEIVVENEEITWPRWRHTYPDSGPWDKDVVISLGPDAIPVVDYVTVPLRIPVSTHVRELFGRCGSAVTLVER